MKHIIHNKLVRDRIPEIIENNNSTCNIEILTEEKYMDALNKKLTEELNEYQASYEIEELADLCEVLMAIVKAKGYTLEEFEKIRMQKVQKRGGFDKRIFLKDVTQE